MIWTKGAHQSAKLQTFDCSRKISSNLYFDRLLNIRKILAKKCRGVISHDPEDWCKIWRKTDLLFQKWQEYGEIWPEHSQVSKTCTFICSYCVKYLMFEIQKYRGVIFHDTEEWCKIWRKTFVWFGKWHEEYGKFSTEPLKVSKLEFWWDSLIQSKKNMRLKSIERWQWRMTQNLKRNWLVISKLTDEEFDEFWPEHLKVSKIFILMCSFSAKYIFFELKKYGGDIFHEIEEGCKIWRGTDLLFQNWHNRNLTNFDLSTWKSQRFSL